MAKFWLDTEFHEYHKQVKVAGIKIGNPIPTIDLISIGIVSEDIYIAGVDPAEENPNVNLSTRKGKEYYAICKDFNLEDAWYANQGTKEKPNYWLRENVLFTIYNDIVDLGNGIKDEYFNFKNFKRIINKYGKTKKQIAEEIIAFTTPTEVTYNANTYQIDKSQFTDGRYNPGEGRINLLCNDNTGLGITIDVNECTFNTPEFYAYYADYDWVVFAQLFGTMMNLPDGFPMYIKYMKGVNNDITFDLALEKLQDLSNYPKQDNEHNALDDAKWNKKLYEFLNKL